MIDVHNLSRRILAALLKDVDPENPGVYKNTLDLCRELDQPFEVIRPVVERLILRKQIEHHTMGPEVGSLNILPAGKAFLGPARR